MSRGLGDVYKRQRKDEVIAALEAAGLTVQEVKEKRGWECIICKKTN